MELSQSTFAALTGLIHEESGISLGADRSYLVRHRLGPLLRREGIADFDALVRQMRLRTGARLRQAVIDAIAIKETRFFRDQNFFDCLEHRVLPSFEKRGSVRVWSAAASTGQEACSVAMLIREMAQSGNAGATAANQFSIVASDLSSEAIEFAKTGRYGKFEVKRGLSEVRLHKHFHLRAEQWCLNESVRRMVLFRTFNLLHSPRALGTFDLILCRNVMIYFNDATRRKVCRALADALREGGWLALGSAESLYGLDHRLEVVTQGKVILYRKPARAAARTGSA